MAIKYTRGSLLPFVAIGVALVIALATVLYIVRHRSEQAKIATQPSVQVTPQSPTESSPQESNPSTSKPSGSGATNTPQDQSADNSSGSNTGGSSSTGSLPKTGPEDTLISLGIVAMITYVFSSYIQSRRQLERLF